MARPATLDDWESVYQATPAEQLPWYRETLDPDIERALVAHELRVGTALDLGTGPGTQAVALAQRGFEVTGTDVADAALSQASERARRAEVRVSFRWDDIIDTRLTGPFDLVVDRGCFHVIALHRRCEYVVAVHRLLATGGHLLLKTFSNLEPGSDGPYRYTPTELRSYFVGLMDIVDVSRTVFQGTRVPEPHALFAVLRKAGRHG